MRKYIGGKLGLFLLLKGLIMATLLFAICLISFLLIKHSPIDPIQAYIGADMLKVGPEQREKIADTFETGSVKEEIKVETCSECHPFYTGRQKFAEAGGRVDRFNKKYGIK